MKLEAINLIKNARCPRRHFFYNWFDDFLQFSDTFLYWNHPKMIFWELPKIVEFLWNFQAICFFIFLVLASQKFQQWIWFEQRWLLALPKPYQKATKYRFSDFLNPFVCFHRPPSISHAFPTIADFLKKFQTKIPLKNTFFDTKKVENWWKITVPTLLHSRIFSNLSAPKVGKYKKFRPEIFAENLEFWEMS